MKFYNKHNDKKLFNEQFFIPSKSLKLELLIIYLELNNLLCAHKNALLWH